MFLTMGLWLSLPRDTRVKLIGIFKIPQSSAIHVMDSQGGKVTDDGHTERDFAVLTAEAMQDFLCRGEATDTWESLFKAVVEKVERGEKKEDVPVAPEATPELKVVTEEVKVVKAKGRPKKINAN